MDEDWEPISPDGPLTPDSNIDVFIDMIKKTNNVGLNNGNETNDENRDYQSCIEFMQQNKNTIDINKAQVHTGQLCIVKAFETLSFPLIRSILETFPPLSDDEKNSEINRIDKIKNVEEQQNEEKQYQKKRAVSVNINNRVIAHTNKHPLICLLELLPVRRFYPDTDYYEGDGYVRTPSLTQIEQKIKHFEKSINLITNFAQNNDKSLTELFLNQIEVIFEEKIHNKDDFKSIDLLTIKLIFYLLYYLLSEYNYHINPNGILSQLFLIKSSLDDTPYTEIYTELFHHLFINIFTKIFTPNNGKNNPRRFSPNTIDLNRVLPELFLRRGDIISADLFKVIISDDYYSTTLIPDRICYSLMINRFSDEITAVFLHKYAQKLTFYTETFFHDGTIENFEYFSQLIASMAIHTSHPNYSLFFQLARDNMIVFLNNATKLFIKADKYVTQTAQNSQNNSKREKIHYSNTGLVQDDDDDDDDGDDDNTTSGPDSHANTAPDQTDQTGRDMQSPPPQGVNLARNKNNPLVVTNHNELFNPIKAVLTYAPSDIILGWTKQAVLAKFPDYIPFSERGNKKVTPTATATTITTPPTPNPDQPQLDLSIFSYPTSAVSLSVRTLTRNAQLPLFLFQNAEILNLDLDLQVLLDCIERCQCDLFLYGLIYIFKLHFEPHPATSQPKVGIFPFTSHLLRATQSHHGTLLLPLPSSRIDHIYSQLVYTPPTLPSQRGKKIDTTQSQSRSSNVPMEVSVVDWEYYSNAYKVCLENSLPSNIYLSALQVPSMQSNGAELASPIAEVSLDDQSNGENRVGLANLNTNIDQNNTINNVNIINPRLPSRLLSSSRLTGNNKIKTFKPHKDFTKQNLAKLLKSVQIDKIRAQMTTVLLDMMIDKKLFD